MNAGDLSIVTRDDLVCCVLAVFGWRAVFEAGRISGEGDDDVTSFSAKTRQADTRKKYKRNKQKSVEKILNSFREKSQKFGAKYL